MNDLWTSVMVGVTPFAFGLYFFWLFLLWNRLACPECGTRAPFLVSPFAKSKRQWVEGGWTCATCGTDVDARGRRVAPGTGPRPGWMARSVLLTLPPAVVAAVLLYLIVTLSWQEPEPRLPPELPRAIPAAAAPVPGPGQNLQ